MINSHVENIDCLEAMARYPDKYFELAIVDPPYNQGSSITNGGTWATKYKNGGFEWDQKVKQEYFNELFRISKNQIICGYNFFDLPATRCFLVWNKGSQFNERNFAECELLYTSFDKPARMINVNQVIGNRIHPTQKPVALYKWLLTNYAKAGDKILDTHLGSGSSRIAAYDLGFDFTGFELDKYYFDASVKRFETHVNQLAIF